jgi:pre-rRNA-processing protein TSR1
MFHNPEDVRWFKPAEIGTKYGLRGHIKEAVGTHGLFKAYFSAPITQNDTVLLVLYKRVFPKFPAEEWSVL